MVETVQVDEEGHFVEGTLFSLPPLCFSILILCLQSKKPAKKAKTKKDDDEYSGGVDIAMNQHVTLTFSLKYLVNFSKSSSLSDSVQLMMSNDVPLLVSPRIPKTSNLLNRPFKVSYSFESGYIRYYLAPKIGDE